MIFTEDDIKAAVKCTREIMTNVGDRFELLDLSDEAFYIKVLEHAQDKADADRNRATNAIEKYCGVMKLPR